MLTQEQIALRHRGIGGSDAAAALGISPWKSQFELYVEKTSEPTRWDQEPRSPEQEWGLRLEEAVADKFAASQGVALYDMKQTLVSDLHPFMVGTPDRIIIPANATHLPHFDGSKLQHADAILELKTARSDYEWGEPGTDQIPLHYLVQTVHYCIVTGLDVAHVAVLFGGSDFRSYVVNCTPDLRDMVYEGERAFWQRVEDRNPPPLVTPNDVRLAYRQDNDGEVEAEPSAVQTLERLVSLRHQVKDAEEEILQCEAALQRFMGEAAYLTVGGIRVVSWRNTAPQRRIDSKALRAKYPDIAAEVEKLTAGGRRFNLLGKQGA